jgi:hypothetical protein
VVAGGPTVNVGVGNQLENARSIAVRLSYGGFQQSIAGDLTGGGDNSPDVESAAASTMGDVDVMVMNHHGSFTSSNFTWVNTLAPEVTVCSCGVVSPYGHPHMGPVSAVLSQPTHQALYRLNQGSSTPGGIVVNGDLKLSTDGMTYTLSGGAVLPTLFNVDSTPSAPQSDWLPGDLIVSEYMQNPAAVSDSQGEWLELFNTTSVARNLQGIVIHDQGTDTFTLPQLTIPARGFLVCGVDGNPALNGGANIDYVWPSGSFFLGNSGDEIALRSPLGLILDQVVYDNGATFPDPNGASVERRDLSALPVASNFGVSTTVFGAGDKGTPGASNSLNATPAWVSITVPTPLQTNTLANIAINGGLSHAGRAYVLGISEATTPGILLPASQRVLDLRFGDLLILSATQAIPVFSNFVGVLSPTGQANASLFVPNLPSFTFHLSGLVLNPAAPDGVAAIMDNALLILP